MGRKAPTSRGKSVPRKKSARLNPPKVTVDDDDDTDKLNVKADATTVTSEAPEYKKGLLDELNNEVDSQRKEIELKDQEIEDIRATVSNLRVTVSNLEGFKEKVPRLEADIAEGNECLKTLSSQKKRLQEDLEKAKKGNEQLKKKKKKITLPFQ